MKLKKLNRFRRKIMPKLTQNIGKSHFNKKVKGTAKTEINNILICRPNQRLGNMLLLTSLLQEVIATFPNCKIDLIVKGNVANQVFKEYQNINKVIILPRKPFKELLNYLKVFFSIKTKTYDLVINGEKGSSSGKILTSLSNAKYKVFGVLEEQSKASKPDDFEHMAKNSVYNLRHYLHQIGHFSNVDKVPHLNMKLTEKELLNGKKILETKIDNSNKKTILIFTYATGAKRLSKDWWRNFYESLKEEFSHTFNILEILPMENVSQIDFKASSFYSKDIRTIAAVIANSELFIGADSGIMHLASVSQTTTLGLFSVTQPTKYKPFGNNSDYINTNQGTIEDYLGLIKHKLTL